MYNIFEGSIIGLSWVLRGDSSSGRAEKCVMSVTLTAISLAFSAKVAGSNPALPTTF